MASITDLATEIIDNICGSMSHGDRLALSMASHHFREIVIRHLFEAVAINTGDPRGAKSFVCEYGHLIKELRIVIAPPKCHQRDCEYCNSLPKAKDSGKYALALLRGDNDVTLPNLQRITLEFPNDFGGHIPLSYDDAENEEQEEMVKQWKTIEKKTLARVVVAFQALSRRKVISKLKRLSIANLPMCKPRHLDALSTPDWKAFLGSLDRFDLSLWAGDGTAFWGQDGHNWWQLAKPAKYTAFIRDLPGHFFDHLTAVKHIRLECSLNAAVGQKDPEEVTRQLPLVGKSSPANTMPLLERLELVKIMVDKPLLDFLKTRAGRPPLSLVLENTWAYDSASAHRRPDGRGMYTKWGVVFDKLTDLISRENGPKLRSFELIPREVTGTTQLPPGYEPPFHELIPFPTAYLESFEEFTVPWGIGAHLSSPSDLEIILYTRKGNLAAEARLMQAIAHSNEH